MTILNVSVDFTSFNCEIVKHPNDVLHTVPPESPIIKNTLEEATLIFSSVCQDIRRACKCKQELLVSKAALKGCRFAII